MSVPNFKEFFIHRVLANLLLLIIFCILMGLGFWQLQRAAEKKIILEHFAKQQQQAPLIWNHQQLVQFAPIRVEGSRLLNIFYLDNQFYQHKIGYHVLVPVADQRNHIIMADLGWIPAEATRSELPNLVIPDWHEWQGVVYYPQLSKVNLGGFVDKQQAQNYVIETLDLSKIAALLHRQVEPWVLRLSSPKLPGVVSDWPLVSVKPERHYAYASQWFLMAGIIIIILIWRWKK